MQDFLAKLTLPFLFSAILIGVFLAFKLNPEPKRKKHAPLRKDRKWK